MSINEINNPQIGGVKMVDIPKEQHQMPVRHYVLIDWMDKLGDKAFNAYLRLLEMAFNPERTLTNEAARVPEPLEDVMKHLKIGSKTTLYNKVIKPLWNYGLIDLQTYEGDHRKTQKPVNIIVYHYPKNEYARNILPLEKVRDYDKQYNSKAKIYANMKPRKTLENVGTNTVQKMYGVKNEENDNDPTVQKVYGVKSLPYKKCTVHSYRTISVRNKVFKELKELKEKEIKIKVNKARARVSYLFDPKYINLKNQVLEYGFTKAESISLLKHVHAKKIIDSLTNKVVMESLTLVASDLDNGIIKCDLGLWTAGKLERVARKHSRKLNLPSRKVSNPANKKVSKKSARGGRKEMIPHWMDDEKKEPFVQSSEVAEEAAKLKAEIEAQAAAKKASQEGKLDLAEKIKKLQEEGIGVAGGSK